LFVIGVIATTLFVSLNAKGGPKMAKDTKPSNVRSLQEGAPIPTLQKAAGRESTLAKGVPIPNLQPVTAKETHGAKIPGLQSLPQAQQSQKSGSGGQGGGASSTGDSSSGKE
jgi:hypothetical protein